MRQIYSIIFATLTALFLLPACSEDIYNEFSYDPSLEEGLSFSFTPGDMTFYKSGGDITAKIETKRHWVIILRDDWLTVSKNSGDGNQELTFTATPLPEGTGDRYTEIEIFVSDGKTQRSYRYTVTQSSYDPTVDSLAEDFRDGIPSNWYTYSFPYTTRSTDAPANWQAASLFGNSAAQACVISGSVNNECETWLVSPAINSNNGELFLSFDSYAELTGGYGLNADFEVYILTDRNPAYGERMLLEPVLSVPDETYGWTNSGEIRLNQFGGTIYIGFKYAPRLNTASYSATKWYITNVMVGPGSTPDNPDNPAMGDGTYEKPFNISYVNSSTEDLTDVWVAGYIVGYVDGTSFDSGVNFTTGSVRTNIILSDSPDTYNVICPAQLQVGIIRNGLNLCDNPNLLGEYIYVRCDIGRYFGRRAVKNITEWISATPPASRAKTRR